MKLFGRKEKNTVSSDGYQQPSGWDSLNGNYLKAEQREISEKEARQQRKMIRLLSTGDERVLDQHDVQLGQGEREWAMQCVTSDGYDASNKRWMVSRIASNVYLETANTVYDKNFGKDVARDWLLAEISGRGGNDYLNVSSADVEKAVQYYPTPVDLEDRAENILNNIRTTNPELADLYSGKMDEVKKAIYGKQQEYFNALSDFESEANEKYRTQEFVMTSIERKDSAEILRKSINEGDGFFGNPNQRLTQGDLWNADLAPAFRVQFEGADIALSKQFYTESGREAVIAYVNSDQGIMQRSYYRSKSQGMWRLLPDYAKVDNSIDGFWYGKGMSEESMILPSELQEALSMVSQQEHANIGNAYPGFLFVGTAKYYNSKSEYIQAMNAGRLRGSVYQETSRAPMMNLAPDYHDGKEPPNQIDVYGDDAPDFKIEKGSYDLYSNVYGDVKVKTYKSKNRNLKYSMCEDAQGRCWVGGVETASPINSAGLRTQWVSAGDLSTPMYEYTQQSYGYGDPNDRRGSYESMWGYVRQIPLVQRYMNREK